MRGRPFLPMTQKVKGHPKIKGLHKGAGAPFNFFPDAVIDMVFYADQYKGADKSQIVGYNEANRNSDGLNIGAADSLYLDITGKTNLFEGTMYVEVSGTNGVGNQCWLQLGTYADGFSVYSAALTGHTVVARDLNTGTGNNPMGPIAAATPYRVAYRYKENDFSASRNGAAAVKDTVGVLPVFTPFLRFGYSSASLVRLVGRVRRVAYWNVGKSDAELAVISA